MTLPLSLFPNKKGLNLLTTWVEVVAFILLVIGFILSIFMGSAFMSYVVILLFGVMAGRVIFFKRTSFPVYVIGMGFLFGYLLGSRYGKWKIILFCFLSGIVISYYLHKKEYGRLWPKLYGWEPKRPK